MLRTNLPGQHCTAANGRFGLQLQPHVGAVPRFCWASHEHCVLDFDLARATTAGTGFNHHRSSREILARDFALRRDDYKTAASQFE
jgi:hypothetical protein